MDGLDKRRSRWCARILGLLLLTAGITSGLSTAWAIEQRQLSQSAMALRMAATEIAHAEELGDLGLIVDPTTIERPTQLLAADNSAVLAILPATDAAEAEELLATFRQSGTLLSDEPERIDGEPAPHDHGDLEKYLAQASDASTRSAASAERFALIAVGVALAMAFLASWFAVRTRYRTMQERSSIDAERRERQRLQLLLDDSPDSTLVIASDGNISYRSKVASGTTGKVRTVQELLDLAEPEQRAQLEQHLGHAQPGHATSTFELSTPSGDTGWFEIRVSDLSDDDIVQGRLVQVRDITVETEVQHELERRASTDALTGLLNRRVLEPRLEAAQSALAPGHGVALLVFDIDGFKTINDTLGHPVGDQLLRLVALRLKNAVDPSHTLIRMGGDEFALIAPGVSDATDAMRIAGELTGTLGHDPFVMGTRREFVRSSVGVAFATRTDDVDRLMTWADLALYEAKRKGGETVELYDPALEETVARQHHLTRALRDARYDDEFSVVFQPIVEARTGKISSLESLLRWESPELGSVGPAEFIPVAEVSGDICAIGRWVFDQVCCQMAAWIEAGIDPDLTVSFNVSAHQLAEPTFVAQILETAERWAVPPGRLVIEVTESAALDQTGIARDRIHELRNSGFRISIDDFGAGYSNLGQLLTIPFDIIKIDRSLLLTLSDMRMQAGGDPSDPCSIMQAIVSIASILDAPVVSEGVETEQQRQSLVASGITHIQGYLTGHPEPASAFAERLLEPAPIRL